MAGLISYGKSERDTEQAIISLKKGAHLFKYGRKGKPKFRPFMLSPDESSLIWISKHGKKSVKLSSVSRILPGQRTAIFRRFFRPDKDYLSFSLIYNNGKRSLDLICKDKVEAEIWITGLKALIPSGQGGRRSKIDGWNDGSFYFHDGTAVSSYTPTGSPSSAMVDDDITYSVNISPGSVHSENRKTAVKGDGIRISVSSAPSTSSHGSWPDDSDALGDVYVWGDVVSDTAPKPLDSNALLDVHHVSCGSKHVALVTRQGEVFTWGHGGSAATRHVETLPPFSVDFVACGEFHTCAVTLSGELYTWGDGSSDASSLLGHANGWVPKQVAGPLDSLQVSSVACGSWHTAVVTSTGRLFTFGHGAFGVLGHGDTETAPRPREVTSLSGLKTVAVACGVWHTAAVVEVIAAQSSCGKLFTWGDGDKLRLGHGDDRPRLEPTCVSSLIDHDFRKAACGQDMTAALTTSGTVFTMGSRLHGQLGTVSDLPCPAEVELAGERVDDVSCGDFHTAVLTSRNEVYTWGKGADGRLGHGDVADRKLPALVESMKDRHVKYVTCGARFTAAICLHRRASGAEQSQCSSCRQAFGFTRKRHTCYSCGLAHCHSCSSRKAAVGPDRSKACRVCDACYSKLDEPKQNKKGNDGTGSKKRPPPLLLLPRVEVPPAPRKASPPRPATPSRSGAESLRRTNELLSREVRRLRAQVASAGERCEALEKEAAEGRRLAAEEFVRSNAAKDVVIGTLTAQLEKAVVGRIPGPVSPKPDNVVELNGIRHLEPSAGHVDSEWMEQFEQGVYITLVTLYDGTRGIKRVRFSRRRFREVEAQAWWMENRERVYSRYSDHASADHR